MLTTSKYFTKKTSNMSQCQSLVLSIVKELLSSTSCEIITDLRPSWLKNPYSKQNMEIDIYLPDLKIGIEIDGKQHEVYVPYLHDNDVSNFVKQKMRDIAKDTILENHGISLIRIHHRLLRSPIKIREYLTSEITRILGGL